MNCILINTENSFNIDKIRELGYPIYCTSSQHVKQIPECEIIELNDQLKKEINKEIFNKVLAWGDKVVNGTRINSLLSFKGFHFWQYHKFRIYFIVRNISYEIELLKKLKEQGYTTIYKLSNYNYSTNEFVGDTSIISLSELIVTKKKNLISLSKYIFVFLIRAISGLFTIKNATSSHLLINSTIEQPCLKPDGSIVNDNYTLGYLFDKINDDFSILEDLIPPKLDQRFNIKKRYFINPHKNRKTYKTDTIVLSGLLSKHVRKDIKTNNKSIFDNLNRLKNESSSSFDQLVISVLFQILPSNKLYLLRYLSFKRFFNSKYHNTVTATDENGPIARTILDAGKIKGITTLGVQHGAIHELHPNYFFTSNERIYKPDYTFIWGEKWKQVLLKLGNYEPRSLLITGQIRTDIIPFLKAKNESNSNFNIVFASQPQRDPVLRENTARDICNAVKNIKNGFLRIKLHPSEWNDFNYYEKIALESGLINFEILSNAELYLTIAESDVVITSFSTVGTEVVYFNKPLIIYDPLKQDLQKYKENGVALQATNSIDIEYFLNEIISGSYKPNTEAYQRFIKDNAYRIDGKVADRCLYFYDKLQ